MNMAFPTAKKQTWVAVHIGRNREGLVGSDGRRAIEGQKRQRTDIRQRELENRLGGRRNSGPSGNQGLIAGEGSTKRHDRSRGTRDFEHSEQQSLPLGAGEAVATD